MDVLSPSFVTDMSSCLLTPGFGKNVGLDQVRRPARQLAIRPCVRLLMIMYLCIILFK